MDWGYLNERINRYNAQPSDDLLYRIGSHADILLPQELELTPERRFRILNWIATHACLNTDIDLALLIFGRQQLEQWLEHSKSAYPDFEFYLCFEFQPRHNTGFESGINFTMHWTPKPGAPVPDTDNDFPWKSFWECGEMFWGDYPGGGKNHFDFNLHCYPDQASFTKHGWVCEQGDWYTTPDERDANLMPVSLVLQHFAVSA